MNMHWLLCAILVSLVLLTSSQRISTNSVDGDGFDIIEGRQGIVTNIQVPNILSAGLQIAKTVPYLEVLRIIEAFLRLKGEVAGRAWALLNDNAHIIAALRDTLISKLGTLHSLTLAALVVLRKVLEFAATLFGNVNISVDSRGPFFDKTINIGR